MYVLCMYVCTYYVYMHVCMYVCMHVCMHVCMYVCMYVRMYICMYVRMYVCTYVHMYVNLINCKQHADNSIKMKTGPVSPKTNVCTYVCMYVSVCRYSVCMYVCMYQYVVLWGVVMVTTVCLVAAAHSSGGRESMEGPQGLVRPHPLLQLYCIKAIYSVVIYCLV